MLSGEGNARERWKTTIDLISKKSNFARAAHFFCTFLCLCFARLQRETSRNFLVVTRFMEECCTGSRSLFFFTAAHFHLPLVAASISHFVAAATKFSCCSSNKKVSSVFNPVSLKTSVALSLVELRWPAAYFLFLFFSVFLLPYIPNLWT